MKKLIALIPILFLSCRGMNSTIIERQKSLTEVCPKCVLTWASTAQGSSSGHWIAQDTSKQPNVIYQVVFCSGVFQPVWKVDYITKIN